MEGLVGWHTGREQPRERRHPLSRACVLRALDPAAPRGRPARGGSAGGKQGTRAPRGEGREAQGTGDPLTFSQPVLEVGVAPSLAVEINAVTDEKGPAHAGGDGAVPAHHRLSTAEPSWLRRGPQISR